MQFLRSSNLASPRSGLFIRPSFTSSLHHLSFWTSIVVYMQHMTKLVIDIKQSLESIAK